MDLHITSRPGDATVAASRTNLNVDRVVVAGGDGTVNEVVNGLKDPSAAPIAILPIGTSNVLAKELGVPRDPEAVAHLLEGGAIRSIALGLAYNRRFVLFVSVGFEALVTKEVSRRRSLESGFRRYHLPVWRSLLRYRPCPLRVSVLGGPRFTGAMALVSNVQRLWGPFRFSPGAVLDSGRFQVVVARDRTRLELLARYCSALVRRTRCCVTTSLSPAREVLIESPWPVPVQVDGDYMGMTPVSVHPIPNCLPVLIPPTLKA